MTDGRPDASSTDAVVIGSGPNGLVAAITLARAGFDVTVLERMSSPGGAVQSEALTLPGYIHDPYSAFYGLLHATPVFRELDLATRVEWAHFESPVGALSTPEAGAYVHHTVDATAACLGSADADAWRAMYSWWEKAGRKFFAAMLAPFPAARPGLGFVRATGIRAMLPTVKMLLQPVEEVARARFSSETARALFTSGVSHTDLSISSTGSTPMTMILAMLAQEHGMPVPVGGAGRLTDALVAILGENGGVVRTGDAVTRIVIERGRAVGVETASGAYVHARHAVLADTGPAPLFRDMVGEEHLPARFLDGLKTFRYGTGMFKVDLALDGPAPWIEPTAASCGVVHLTGTLDDMARANFEAGRGLLPAEPMLIIGQQCIADATRAPAGAATLWVETHVPPHPRGDGADASRVFDGWAGEAREIFIERVLARLEAFAPGVRARIVGQFVRTPTELQAMNPNLVGGDVGGGSSAIDQQLVFRPVPGWFRYSTPIKGLWLCSASAHPGGGVHGMAGRNAARRVIRASRSPRGLVKTATGARRAPRR